MAPGSPIEVEVDFSATNSKTCPTCIRQLVIALEEETRLYARPETPPIAVLNVAEADVDFFFSETLLNGTDIVSEAQEPVEVLAEVEIEVFFFAAQTPDCLDCRRQYVVWLEDQPLGCAYDDVSPTVPVEKSERLSWTTSLVVPRRPGRYDLYGYHHRQADCEDAIAASRLMDPLSVQRDLLGSIFVEDNSSPATPVRATDVSLNGQGDTRWQCGSPAGGAHRAWRVRRHADAWQLQRRCEDRRPDRNFVQL